ncbi:MAG TPA: Smr/MutS family protein [Methylocystis sp.]|nr:Smr/MutS family protein [Methylocystis sp.]
MSEEQRPTRFAKGPSAHELELWEAVTADVRPFRDRPRVQKPAAAAEAHTPPAAVESRFPQPARKPQGPAEIDHRTRVKLRRGRLEVDARLDLHGMRQAEAHAALNGFLRRAQAAGARIVIVVTGKGRGGDGAGVLRRLAPLWLQSSGLRDVVVGFGEAARQHGGEGALYVRIRSRRVENF